MRATGNNIRKLIKERGLTVAGIREAMNLGSVQPVYRWMSGKTMPTIDHLADLSTILGVTIDQILVMKPEKNRKDEERDAE